jgi:hypothetical protein
VLRRQWYLPGNRMRLDAPENSESQG